MPLIQTDASEFEAAIAPSGRWLAYSSFETRRWDVYLDRFPELGARQPISTDGGIMPTWSRDGRALFYLDGDRPRFLMRVSVEDPTGGSSFPTVGTPEPVVDFDYFRHPIRRRSYNVSPDGDRFLVISNLGRMQTRSRRDTSTSS